MKITKSVNENGEINLTFENLPDFPTGTKFYQSQNICGTENIIYFEGLERIVWGDFEFCIYRRTGNASFKLAKNKNIEEIAEEIVARYTDFEEQRQEWIEQHDNKTCIVVFSDRKRDEKGRFIKKGE